MQGNVNNLQTGDMVEFSILTNQVKFNFYKINFGLGLMKICIYSAMENHLDVMLLK